MALLKVGVKSGVRSNWNCCWAQNTGRKRVFLPAWLEVALWREQRGEGWAVRLHPHGLQYGQNPAFTESRSCCHLDRALFLPPQGHCRFGSWHFFGETSRPPPGIWWVPVCARGRAAGPRWVPTACCSLCDWCARPAAGTDFAGRGLGGGSDGGGGLGLETPVLSCSWIATCFVLPPPPVLPPLPFLHAREHKKNNFLCNLATRNPIPDKL